MLIHDLNITYYMGKGKLASDFAYCLLAGEKKLSKVVVPGLYQLH